MDLICPHCSAGCKVPDNADNTPARCHRCRKTFLVPSIFDLLPPALPPEEISQVPPVPFQPSPVVPIPKTKKRPSQPNNDDEDDEAQPPRITKNIVNHYHPPQSQGGCGPVLVELVVAFVTVGFLGGCGPLAAGKGPSSLCISILGCLLGWVLVLFSWGFFFPVLAIFVFVKWIIDLVNSAS